MLHLMTQQTRRMQTLVSDLLTLARWKAARARPTAGCSRCLIAVLRPSALSSGRQPDSASDATGVELAGWRPSCRAPSSNLPNAVRYTPDGGEIGLQLAAPGRRLGEVSCRTTAGIAREHFRG